MSSASGKLKPAHEKIVVMAETLDGIEDSREEAIMIAVMKKSQTEQIDDLRYSMRLMRPKETRRFIRSKIHWAMIRVAEDHIVKTPPVQKLARVAVEHMAILSNIAEDAATG